MIPSTTLDNNSKNLRNPMGISEVRSKVPQQGEPQGSPSSPTLSGRVSELAAECVTTQQTVNENAPSLDGRVTELTLEDLIKMFDEEKFKKEMRDEMKNEIDEMRNEINDLFRKQPISHPWIARIVHWVESKFK